MKIIKPHTLPEQSAAIYGRNKLGLYSDIHIFGNNLDDGNYLVEAIVIGLVTEGQINLTIDDAEYQLKRGDFFACRPNNIISKSMMSFDFHSLVISVSAEYGVELADKAGLDWTFRTMAERQRTLHLDDFQINAFQNVFEFLHRKILSQDTPNKDRCIDHTILALFYQVLDMSHPKAKPAPMQTYSSKENLLQRFTMMLKDSNPLMNSTGGYLSVKEYAERLSVTPKYFSTTCKCLTGKTAGQIIDDEIMTTAKILLRDNTKSIKQIAEMLGFANQSHFGTYFNRKTGMSPQLFRKSK